MTEIIMLIVLCINIRKIAHERKRKATWFIVLTLVLWLVFEMAFAFTINFFLLPRFEFVAKIHPYSAYFVVLGGLVGGGIAYLIVKNCPIGTYEAPGKSDDLIFAGESADFAKLAAPCEIKIVRDKGFVGWAVSYTLFLNGEEIKLRSGQHIIKMTSTAYNVIQFKTNHWKQTNDKPLPFIVKEGQPAEIHIKAGHYVHKKHKGITLI